MATRMYSYAGCGTCKKAKAWLDGRNVPVEIVPIVERPPSKTALRKLWKQSGLPLKRLFNTSGQSYRVGKFGDRLPSMSDDEALGCLAADGKLIKRPLLVTEDNNVLVGFREAEYEAIFGESI